MTIYDVLSSRSRGSHFKNWLPYTMYLGLPLVTMQEGVKHGGKPTRTTRQ